VSKGSKVVGASNEKLRIKSNNFPITRGNVLIHIDSGLIDYTRGLHRDINRGASNNRLTEEERELLQGGRRSLPRSKRLCEA